MAADTDTEVRVIDLTEAPARVIAIEDAQPTPGGIPVYVRRCTGCGRIELDGDWYFAPDRDLGIGWSCGGCGAEDQYAWAQTSLSDVGAGATARISY